MGRDGGERQDEDAARLVLFLRMLYTNCFETLPGGQIDEVSSFLSDFFSSRSLSGLDLSTQNDELLQIARRVGEAKDAHGS